LDQASIQHGIQIAHSNFERIDKETIKMLCVSCGGKGFYLLIEGVPGVNMDPKGVIMPCEECEDGFKYSKMVSDHNGS